MHRKTKSGEPDRRHGGYRHGVPGGGAQTRIAIDCTLDVKERWQAAAVADGFPPTRSLSPFVIKAVEEYIRLHGLETKAEE